MNRRAIGIARGQKSIDVTSELSGLLHQMPCPRVGLGSGHGHLLLNLFPEPLPEEDCYFLGQVVLKCKDFLVWPFEGGAAKFRPSGTVYQSHRQSQASTGLGHRTLDQRPHLQGPGDTIG